ncbi:diacylglycerol kinase [Desulfobulbus rhabdoformis]|uniref:diacylglycerol kinase n=1 Tax=Desulfobulbus rhabdoformis TaxID=34032 RepID=UPI001965274E|nr:diacylglycerol kinase [Desulfobulbus rhabdoformis]MBM9613072.1 diacylglycerol kinase [Desulfobulbus rhabdoformis]
MTEQGKINGTGLGRIIRAAVCSKAGILAAFRNEAAFRQEVLLCAVLLPVALWLGENSIERALLISSLLLVLIVELINTAIEVVVDRISADRHELSGLAKDVGSAAVFVALVLACIDWGLILLFS